MAKKKEEDDEKDKDDEPELVVVTDDERNLDVEPGPSEDVAEVQAAAEAARLKREEEAKSKEEDEEDDEEEEDTRLGKSEESEEEEEARQRSPHKSRRQRRKEAENRLRMELKFLEGRNDQLERTVSEMARRLDQGDRNTLEERIANTKALIKKADSIIAEAISNSKGEEAAEAQSVRDTLRERLQGYETAKAKAEERGDDSDRPAAPPPRVLSNLKAWHDQNKWFDFRRGDMDSKIAGAIDDSLVDEGYDPASDDYWDELNARIAKALPHRAGKKKAKKPNGQADDADFDEEGDEDEEQEERRPKKKVAKVNGEKPRQAAGGPKFRTGGSRELKPNEVYVSAERIAALKDAGVWEDPVLRKKYLKRYQEYDRLHANDRS